MRRNVFAGLLSILIVLAPVTSADQSKRGLPEHPRSKEDILGELQHADGRGPLIGCMYKMERYGGLRGDKYDGQFRNYDLALEAGQRCLDAGVDTTPAGWLVHVWMAYFHKEKGQLAPARKHLKIAASLDKEGRMAKLNVLARYGLEQ